MAKAKLNISPFHLSRLREAESQPLRASEGGFYLVTKMDKDFRTTESQLKEEFILTYEIKGVKFNTFIPIAEAFYMDKQNYNLVQYSEEDYASNSQQDEIRSIVLNAKKPSPEKEFKNVSVNIIPEKENNPQIREIREQLINSKINHPFKDYITLCNIEYIIEVEKLDNICNYYFYNQEKYALYEKRLEKAFKNLSKKWNDVEYNRLFKRIDEVNNYSKSEEADKLSHYLDDVKFRFDEWYREYNFESPNTNQVLNKKYDIEETETPKKKVPLYHGALTNGFNKYFKNYKKKYAPERQTEIATLLLDDIKKDYDFSGKNHKDKHYIGILKRYIRKEMKEYHKKKKKGNWS